MLADLPGSFGGTAPYAAANALAATAAARTLGVPAHAVAQRLPTFTNPGRGTLLRLGSADRAVHVLVDYAHNPAAIAAVSGVVRRGWAGTVAVVTLPGDRSDELLRESARVVAEAFDRVVLYEDADRRGRRPGEVPALVRAEIEAYRPGSFCTITTRVDEAVHAALAVARPGDVLLVLYEKVEPLLRLLTGIGVVPVTDRIEGLPGCLRSEVGPSLSSNEFDAGGVVARR